MTYQQYVARARRMQLDYIAEETKRNEKLLKLWYDYKAKASKLGFHALDRSEIIARSDELKGMLARVDTTHGDTPAMRSLFEMHRTKVKST